MRQIRMTKKSLFALSLIGACSMQAHAEGHLIGGIKFGAAFSQFSAKPTMTLTGSPSPNFIGDLNKKPSGFVGELFLGYHKSYDGFYLWNDFSIATPNPKVKQNPFDLDSTSTTDTDPLSTDSFEIKPGFTLGAGIGIGFDITDAISLETGLKFLLTNFKTSIAYGTISPSNSRYGFGVAPTLQVGYKVTNNMTATLGYAYHIYQSLQTTVMDNNIARIRSSNYTPRYHYVMAGLTYKFDSK